MLADWSTALVERLNKRLAEYGVDCLAAELEPDSQGEKIDVPFPRVAVGGNNYQLDHVLLEFGGRNRGQPIVAHEVECYLAEVHGLSDVACPRATAHAYDPAYIFGKN